MKHKRHISRAFWFSLGVISLILGIIGIPLPLLPTTPFLLLAAFSFSQSSERLHDWIMSHPQLSPPIHDWQKHGAISTKGKVMAGIAMLAALLISIVFGAPLYAIILQSVVLAFVSLFLFTRPGSPRK